MTKVAIMAVPDEHGHYYFNAVAGDKQTQGATAGAALDAMNEQLGDGNSADIIMLQNHRPDAFFSAEQKKRLEALMKRWRIARDRGNSFPEQEQRELEELIEQELQASTDRATKLSNELGQ